MSEGDVSSTESLLQKAVFSQTLPFVEQGAWRLKGGGSHRATSGVMFLGEIDRLSSGIGSPHTPQWGIWTTSGASHAAVTSISKCRDLNSDCNDIFLAGSDL